MTISLNSSRYIIGTIIEFLIQLNPSGMKKIILLAVAVSTLYSCARNAVTGRNQLTLVPESEVQANGAY